MRNEMARRRVHRGGRRTRCKEASRSTITIWFGRPGNYVNSYVGWLVKLGYSIGTTSWFRFGVTSWISFNDC